MKKVVSKAISDMEDMKPEYDFSGMKMPKMLIICTSIVLLYFILVTTGCETKKSRQPFNEKNACTLLTKEEVETALKWNLKEPQLQVSETTSLYTASSCAYENKKSGESLWVNFQFEKDPDPNRFKVFRDESAASGMKITIAEGIGDSAYFIEGRLEVMKKKYRITLTPGGSEKLSEEAVKSLAKKAVDRIP